MLPADLLNTIKAYALAQKPQLIIAAEAAPKTGAFEAGQRFQGSVQTQVAPGVFKVRIADQLIQMRLPASIKSGDTIDLQVIATQPRLTFSMAGSANPLSTPEQLGSMSRLLSSMSQQNPEKAYVRAEKSAPLWDTPQPPESRQLAGRLQEALSNSGLFYESHQAQWLEGTRSTLQLLHEPQNLQTQMNAQAMAAAETGTANTPTAEPHNPASSAAAPSLPEGKTPGIPEHLQSLVQQQLNALETRQMLWQGNVWPEQTMQWEIHEQIPQNSGINEQRQWVTQIQLDLPKLGEVAATLRFNAAGLSLTLNAATEETRAALGNASTRLIATLSDMGITVLNTKITTI